LEGENVAAGSQQNGVKRKNLGHLKKFSGLARWKEAEKWGCPERPGEKGPNKLQGRVQKVSLSRKKETYVKERHLEEKGERSRAPATAS